ncbi:MAG: ABC transporter ATP-binding protein [Lachnospiraceae bacterium]|nr:ABC transporter ATP-binding protein [Lachnospiraceae bacterium]
MEKEILGIEHLSVSFIQYGKGLTKRWLYAVEDLSLLVHAGEIVAVVGSSGSGKSLLAHAVMGLLPYNGRMEGKIWFDGEPLTQKRAAKLRGRELFLVPQNVSYLDPLMRVGEQVMGKRPSPSLRDTCRKVFAGYGLDAQVGEKYPFQLSGGMIRRILISTAVMGTPKLVIADEPTPGLHPEAARRVMGHFKELAAAGAGVLLITHDLELALMTADRVAVLYGGRMIEEAPASVFTDETNLTHAYTRALCRSMPKNWDADGERLCDTGDILLYMRKEYGR